MTWCYSFGHGAESPQPGGAPVAPQGRKGLWSSPGPASGNGVWGCFFSCVYIPGVTGVKIGSCSKRGFRVKWSGLCEGKVKLDPWKAKQARDVLVASAVRQAPLL